MPLYLGGGLLSVSWPRRRPPPVPVVDPPATENPSAVVTYDDGTAFHVFLRRAPPARSVNRRVNNVLDSVRAAHAQEPLSPFSRGHSVVPGPGDMTPRGSSAKRAVDDVDVREALRAILARQDMMEARQAQVMNQLESLGRQVSVQQQTLQDTLDAAKTAMSAVEKASLGPLLGNSTTPSSGAATSTTKKGATPTSSADLRPSSESESSTDFLDGVATVGQIFNLGDDKSKESKEQDREEDPGSPDGQKRKWYRPWS